jgi:hypothetical protein
MKWVKISEEADSLVMDFTVENFKKLHGLEAALYTIKEIEKNYPPPYTLMVSGGIDSQAMLYAWHISGVKFNTISARYNLNLNDHDLETLEQFSKQYSIDISYMDLDIFKFYQEEYDHYATTFNCSSPQVCVHMKIADLIKEGTVISSGNLLVPYKAAITYAMSGITRYAESCKRPMIPYFFLETPELAYSIFERSKIFMKQGYQGKVDDYLESGFPVIAQTEKLTGFEKVKDYYDQFCTTLVTARHRLQLISDNPSRRVFDLLLRHPYERKLKHLNMEFKTNP